jgi:hypothetical protein
MIIFDAIVMHLPVCILAYGVNSSNPAPYLVVYTIYDKIEIAVFFVQESIISVVYIYETIRLLGSGGAIKRNPMRQLLAHLILVNTLVLIFDIALLGIQYSGYYEIQTTMKPALYSLKLKIEFSVLNRLVAIVQNKDFSQGNINNNWLPFDTFGSSNATQVNSGSADHDGFIKMDDAPTLPKDSLQPRVRTTELVMESGEPGNRNDNPMVSGKGGKRGLAEV